MNTIKYIFPIKKYLALFFSVLFVTITAQKKFTIVLDAGHGGSDHGAYRSYSDLGTVREKDVTLSVVLKLGEMLEKNKDLRVIYTRKEDIYPNLTSRTNLANRSKADLFISIHCNAAKSSAYGTETFVQGPDQNAANLEVAKSENDVIFLDEEDKQTFASYDPKTPESLIALKLQQQKYLERSLIFGSFVEDNFVNKDKRFSRGVKQKNLHVLRLNAMPSVLIEMGFISNYDEAAYLSSESGQKAIVQSIYNAVVAYKKLHDKTSGKPSFNDVPEKPKEQPLKNDFRVLLMSSADKFNDGDPALKGLNYIFTIKEGNFYKYYYGTTNYASIKDANVKTAKDAGFRNAVAIGFVPNQKLAQGYYTLEVAVTDKKLGNDSYILKTLNNVERNRNGGKFYYTYGKFSTLEEAVSEMKSIENKGVKNIVVEKVIK
ncbi:N-acetylmuramoyl-L-alanine amidase [Riemerella anatipestifer]|uniref:N-acetylmuramoyl-L-alanine amidase family protein n=1 Tax=Riemerella anatipestifer TaxID=34085 RepID=UPI001BD99345|nr:N-acetylmuramoyl-L-alanine amidase [Riemerella anatipestifer]MBT0526430.1 N-acetylmuramoyl-L-alanine amidase [Riemerella anatipestifer]MBT0528297.1 N-acetylmuramoyl-L-alanine amidase [Riemerella anatipestifer]MBT0530337.1 N-acetylmuramoyl-L-alanine amidase [Riemerella anatipestifer]MBT0532136.1 N-acetylmuramoyl-L-alanine amidase [Riemerella anatipestifer]MBT0536308.1 N-acetylmuramoyl-L-alanine amidase [Riemerella anatipestifer]